MPYKQRAIPDFRGALCHCDVNSRRHFAKSLCITGANISPHCSLRPFLVLRQFAQPMTICIAKYSTTRRNSIMCRPPWRQIDGFISRQRKNTETVQASCCEDILLALKKGRDVRRFRHRLLTVLYQHPTREYDYISHICVHLNYKNLCLA